MLGRAVDAVVGIVVGGVVWAVLSFVLSIIPVLGWIVAAIIAGYIAGRLGGGAAAALLAILSPILTFFMAESILMAVLSFIPLPDWLTAIITGALTTVTVVWALINLCFVGIGGAVGSRSYKSVTCPYCHERVAKKATVCLACGRELKPPTTSGAPTTGTPPVPGYRPPVQAPEEPERGARLSLLGRLRSSVGFPFEESEIPTPVRVDIGRASSTLLAAQRKAEQYEADRATRMRLREHVKPAAYARALTWIGAALVLLTPIWFWYDLSGLLPYIGPEGVIQIMAPGLIIAIATFAAGKALESHTKKQKLKEFDSQTEAITRQQTEDTNRAYAEVDQLVNDLANRVRAAFKLDTELPSQKLPPEKPRVVEIVSGKFCIECGKPIPPQKHFCTSCGTKAA